MKLALIIVSVLLAQNSYANSDCASELKRHIAFAYNDGGLKLLSIVGPIHYNESIGNPSDGTAGIASKVAFAVSYGVDLEVLPNAKGGNQLVIAECAHSEPETLVDTNGDGIINLEDAETKGN